MSLEKHESLDSDPVMALKETFIKTNAALMVTKIDYMTSGCTCVAVYVVNKTLHVANVGDSRAVVAVESGGSILAKDLSRDHKPNDADERARIIEWGGFVSDPAEEGLSSRVYLDADLTRIGLAMSRSIGTSIHHNPTLKLHDPQRVLPSVTIFLSFSIFAPVPNLSLTLTSPNSFFISTKII